MLSSFARPKVNLFLHVTGRRNDGYHLLESLVVFPDGGDELAAQLADQITLSVSGPFADVVGPAQNNLVLTAATILNKHAGTQFGAHISLTKNLPVAAGIGGGSADAAAALRLLNNLWGLDLGREELAEMGLKIGADVPACVYSTPLIMSGIGEKLAEINKFPKIHIILVNSKIKVSTAEIFRRLSAPYNSASETGFVFDPSAPMMPQLLESRNDMQAAALEMAPEIDELLALLDAQADCQLARMSGSGGTCFGLFPTRAAAEQAASRIEGAHPDWWVKQMVIPANRAP
ncbi:MAG: 4-(cytidine 5'-diphospho)-2-C-methyl-D-erythritol kinase [Sneathiella sp.]|nr:MAG: 4-(cytidine 5'-diphospho)-2-C-methyl-D-erythritol kinase [Sneathiella sp.]